MKNTDKRILCVLLALTLTGCASAQTESRSDINIIDAGGAAPISSSAELTTASSAEEPVIRTEPALSDEVSVQAPEQTTSEQTTSEQTTSEQTTSEQTTSEQTTSVTTTVPEPEETEPAETTTTTAETTTTAATTTTTAASTTIATTTTAVTTRQEPVVAPTVSGALNHDEVKGVWISYLEYTELLTGKSEYTFRENISEAFDNCVDLGLNTVYVHARSHGDAYYDSELFPWSRYASGSINSAPAFDPLEIMVEEAHERDISIHAWINPLRLCSASDMKNYGDHIVAKWNKDSKTAGKYVVEVNGTYYLNPAYDEVIDLICDGAEEILLNYDVDGLHIDDYFYPTTDSSFDSDAFAASGEAYLSDFRFDNCDELVSALYDSVKSTNADALFSVSVQGSIENNYNQLYADVEKWCAEDGFLDYIVPQIYYGFDNSTQPYSECLSRWEEICTAGGVPLVVGLTVSKIGYEDVWAGEGEFEWIEDSAILARQLTEAMECRSYGGVSLYSYRSIYSAAAEVKSQVWEEINGFTALLG